MPVNVGITSSTGYLVTPTKPIRDNLQLFLDPANETSYAGGTSTSVKDLSAVNGSDNIFTANNVSQADSQEAGYFNNFKFDGTNEYLLGSVSSTINVGTGNFTLQMWINRPPQTPPTPPLEEFFFSQGDPASGKARFFSLGTSDGQNETSGTKLVCVIKPTNTIFSFATKSSLGTNQWINIAWAFTRTVADNKLYLNGVADTISQKSGNSSNWSGAGTLTNSLEPVVGAVKSKTLGIYQPSQAAFGPILYYNRLLSSDEILHNYRLHANRYGLI